MNHFRATVATVALVGAQLLGQSRAQLNEELLAAAQTGDEVRIARALDAGAEINARTVHGPTALWFAADRGSLAAVRLLVDRGADMSLVGGPLKWSPLNRALINDHRDIARFLLEKGSKGAADALLTGIAAGDVALVRAALAASDLDVNAVASALPLATREGGNAQIAAFVKAAADRYPPEVLRAVLVDEATLASYAGTYRHEGENRTITLLVRSGQLIAQSSGQPTLTLVPSGHARFRAAEVEGQFFTFSGEGANIDRLMLSGASTVTLTRPAPSAAKESAPAKLAPASSIDPGPPRAAPRNWPSFRGPDGSGVADGQGAVADWDLAKGTNIKWKTPIPGLAMSSPIVWGDRVIVTTAIGADTTVRTGYYRTLEPVNDVSNHEWKIYALDKKTGRVVWERLAASGPPGVKRHPKGSQANSTPATDGKHIVAFFGTIGLLVCYDMGGKLLWQKNLGPQDSGWVPDPMYQFGPASSPIIYGSLAIVQADRQKDSFIAAWDLSSGREVWNTRREDEISTWGTPAIVRGQRDELVTNGSKVRGYDPVTGKLLWTLGPNSEITVATPVVGPGLVYVTGGYPPVRPVYAIRPGARGDISLPKGSDSSEFVAWSNDREGTYIPTPIFYRGYLYTCNNSGILSAYSAETGERIYRGRIGSGGSFAASPIAADGRLYFATEEGQVYVVRAGPKYEELARIEMNEVIMATPAVSDGLIILRTLGHAYGIGQ